MELILFILKIILITFLGLFGLITLLLGIILLVPIRYEVSGSIGDSWEIKVRGKVTYLLAIIKLLFSYENEQFDMKFLLFGFEKVLKQEEAVEKEETEGSAEATTDSKEEIADLEVKTADPAEETVDLEVKMSVPKEETVALGEETILQADVQKDSVEEQATTEKTQNSGKRKNVKKVKSKNSFNFAFWKQQLTDEHNKSVVRKIWSELCYLFRHFRFRKIQTDLVFATGDPASTGQVLGILCMMPMLYRHQFKIIPDFDAEKFYIKGTFLIAGKVRLIHVLITGLRLIFDKEVRLVVKKFLTLLEK